MPTAKDVIRKVTNNELLDN